MFLSFSVFIRFLFHNKKEKTKMQKLGCMCYKDNTVHYIHIISIIKLVFINRQIGIDN